MVNRSEHELMEELLTLELEGRLPELFYFWGHTPRGSSPVGPWVLSQWWPTRFVVDGIEYFHSEGFMMAAKGAPLRRQHGAREDPASRQPSGSQAPRSASEQL
jgi:predicted NAD-dependent protein-ADP-ribosyltransferase YbiA (DUF1768 family)